MLCLFLFVTGTCCTLLYKHLQTHNENVGAASARHADQLMERDARITELEVALQTARTSADSVAEGGLLAGAKLEALLLQLSSTELERSKLVAQLCEAEQRFQVGSPASSMRINPPCQFTITHPVGPGCRASGLTGDAAIPLLCPRPLNLDTGLYCLPASDISRDPEGIVAIRAKSSAVVAEPFHSTVTSNDKLTSRSGADLITPVDIAPVVNVETTGNQNVENPSESVAFNALDVLADTVSACAGFSQVGTT